MKFFSSELGHSYDTYTFGYANYCQREAGDALGDIYGAGYLPYSSSPEAMDIFYMARSARVVLPQFELSSENRRIAKKFDGAFTRTCIPFSEFKPDEGFFDFCLSYFKERHGGVMPRARLEFLLNTNLRYDIMKYHTNGKPVAYVLEVSDGTIGHYWFSFYDLSLVQQSLGMWLMLDCIRAAKERALTHYYLGTVYGHKALYKTNFEPLEWWEGGNWSTDAKLLRERARTDENGKPLLIDRWEGKLKRFN